MYLLNSLLICIFFASVASQTYEALFEKWVEEFKVAFQSAEHRAHMFGSWVDNHLFIEASNKLNRAFELGHNQFSGMNHTEYLQWVRGSQLNVVNVVDVNTASNVL